MLDGVSATVFGLIMPLIAADLTRRTGYLNLAIGSLGLAAGLGATASTTVAGWVADTFGRAGRILRARTGRACRAGDGLAHDAGDAARPDRLATAARPRRIVASGLMATLPGRHRCPKRRT